MGASDLKRQARTYEHHGRHLLRTLFHDLFRNTLTELLNQGSLHIDETAGCCRTRPNAVRDMLWQQLNQTLGSLATQKAPFPLHSKDFVPDILFMDYVNLSCAIYSMTLSSTFPLKRKMTCLRSCLCNTVCAVTTPLLWWKLLLQLIKHTHQGTCNIVWG